MCDDKLENIKLIKPLEPEIELDGGYVYCQRCYTELDRWQYKCRHCGQLQDWTWLTKWEIKGKYY